MGTILRGMDESIVLFNAFIPAPNQKLVRNKSNQNHVQDVLFHVSINTYIYLKKVWFYYVEKGHFSSNYFFDVRTTVPLN